MEKFEDRLEYGEEAEDFFVDGNPNAVHIDKYLESVGLPWCHYADTLYGDVAIVKNGKRVKGIEIKRSRDSGMPNITRYLMSEEFCSHPENGYVLYNCDFSKVWYVNAEDIWKELALINPGEYIHGSKYAIPFEEKYVFSLKPVHPVKALSDENVIHCRTKTPNFYGCISFENYSKANANSIFRLHFYKDQKAPIDISMKQLNSMNLDWSRGFLRSVDLIKRSSY